MELPKKVRKPMMEKKRRARINDSLERLKEILLHNTAAVTHGSKPTKLEKADILEMTIRYIQSLQPTNTVSKSTPSHCNHTSSMDFIAKHLPSKISCSSQSLRSLSTLESEPIHLSSRIDDKENNGAHRIVPNNDLNRIERSAFKTVSNINERNNYESKPSEQHWRPWYS